MRNRRPGQCDQAGTGCNVRRKDCRVHNRKPSTTHRAWPSDQAWFLGDPSPHRSDTRWLRLNVRPADTVWRPAPSMRALSTAPCLLPGVSAFACLHSNGQGDVAGSPAQPPLRKFFLLGVGRETAVEPRPKELNRLVEELTEHLGLYMVPGLGTEAEAPSDGEGEA